MAKMEIGEKFLCIKVVGHDYIYAFPNKDKKGKEPDFKSEGVAVWVRQKTKQGTITEERVL